MEPDISENFLPTRRSLLGRLKQWDDRRSWEEFVKMYERLIYSVAIKSGLRDHEASDVVQDTLISVAKELPNFQYDPEKGSFKGWLRMITRRRIVDFWRKRSRQVQTSDPLPSDDTQSTPLDRIADPNSPEMDEIWEDEWRRHLMAAGLERIKKEVSPKAYQVFDLCVLQEVPTPEVASSLGMSAGNIYITKHRVSQILKKEVRKIEKEYEARAAEARRAGGGTA